MSEVTSPVVEAAPAATPAPAEAPAKTAGKIPSAAELLAELGGQGEPPANTNGEAPPEVKADEPGDPETTKRLARLAREQAKLDKARKAFEAEQSATKEAAANWQKLQDAKSKGDRLAVLETLYAADEIETDLYLALTERIHGKAQGEQPLTKAEVDDLVAQRFEAAKKAEQEAAEKAKQTQQEAAEAEQIQVQQGFIQYVVDAFDPAKYPLIATVRLPADDILGAAEAYYKEHQKAPTAEELLTAIESELKERVSKVVAPPTAPAVEIKPPPTGVRSNWKSDAPPVERKSKGTPADWTREALREVGIAVK